MSLKKSLRDAKIYLSIAKKKGLVDDILHYSTRVKLLESKIQNEET